MAEAAAAQLADDHVAGAVENGAGDGEPPSHSNGGGGTWEIEELEPEERPAAQQQGGGGGTAEDVYVAVGKGGSSAAALSWALRRLTKPRSFVYLVHVFPVVTTIPTPLREGQVLGLGLEIFHACVSETFKGVVLTSQRVSFSQARAFLWSLANLSCQECFGFWARCKVATAIIPLRMMPKSRASPEQIETYMSQERSKRREMLQKFLDQCRSFQVNVDVYLIESDQIANAIIELIPVLHIKQLILGLSKSNVRKLKRGTTIAGQVQKSAPLYCEVKIICDAKEVTAVTTADPTPPLSPSPVNNNRESNNPTPPSSTPKHSNTSGNGVKKDSETRERKKITKFFRCFSL
ncbi:hypothetical protein ACP4OV_001312 [Aristida adscensionis]